MPRIVRTEACGVDLLDISTYIARDNLQAADALINTFDEKFKMLAEFPHIGRQRPEFGRAIRSLPVGQYIIFYRPIQDGIQILRVLHGNRNLRRAFRKR